MTTAPASPMLEPLIDAMRRRIDAGEFKPGQRLPSLRHLADEFAMSVAMARKAMVYLRDQGMVRLHQGSGCYVNPRARRTPGSPRLRTKPTGRSTVHILINRDSPGAIHLLMPTITALQDAKMTLVVANCTSIGDVKQLRHLSRLWRDDPPAAVVIQGNAGDLYRQITEHAATTTRIISTYGHVWQTGAACDHVNPHEDRMYQMAADYLLDRGHKTIGLVTARRPLRHHTAPILRRVNCHILSVVRAAARRRCRAKVCFYPHGGSLYALAGRHPENLKRIAAWLGGPNRPTGVIGRSFRLDTVKIAARRLGLEVGRDLELIGIGDLTPALVGEYPCISEGPEQIAEEIVRLVQQGPTPGELPCDIRIAPVFVPCQAEPVTPHSLAS